MLNKSIELLQAKCHELNPKDTALTLWALGKMNYPSMEVLKSFRHRIKTLITAELAKEGDINLESQTLSLYYWGLASLKSQKHD